MSISFLCCVPNHCPRKIFRSLQPTLQCNRILLWESTCHSHRKQIGHKYKKNRLFVVYANQPIAGCCRNLLLVSHYRNSTAEQNTASPDKQRDPFCVITQSKQCHTVTELRKTVVSAEPIIVRATYIG